MSKIFINGHHNVKFSAAASADDNDDDDDDDDESVGGDDVNHVLRSAYMVRLCRLTKECCVKLGVTMSIFLKENFFICNFVFEIHF